MQPVSVCFTFEDHGMCSTKADMPNLLEHMQTVEGRATTGPRLSEDV